MDLKNKEKILKKDIKNNLISQDLTELLKPLIAFTVVTCIFGYIGYSYSSQNNGNVPHDTIFFILYPVILATIREIFGHKKIITSIIFTIVYICCAEFLPTIVGIIIFSAIIVMFVGLFIHIECKDRAKEVERIYEDNKIIVAKSTEHNTIKKLDNIDFSEENLKIYNNKNDEEKYECEICFKEISYEEYELYDGMCEECFMSVHIDEQGKYHDEEYWNR